MKTAIKSITLIMIVGALFNQILGDEIMITVGLLWASLIFRSIGDIVE